MCGLFSNKHNGTASIKTVITSQYYSINWYKDLKRKILKCNSNIHFNKQFVNTGLIPKYAKIKGLKYFSCGQSY